MHWSRKPTAIAVAVLLAVLLATATVFAADPGALWIMGGHDLNNTRYQNAESRISVANAGNLAVKWQFTTGGDVSATPAVDGLNAHVPDWAGNLYALDRGTGALVWSHKIADYTGIAGDSVRSTPAVVGNALIFGDQGGKLGGGAWVMAVNRQTGSLLWKTQVESQVAAIVTQSAVADTNPSRASLTSMSVFLPSRRPWLL